MAEQKHLVVTEFESISVVSFREPTMLDAYHVQAVGDELYKLVSEQGLSRLIIDLGSIKMLSSQALSVLLNLRKMVEEATGEIAISGVDPRLYRVFKVTNLQNLFEFYQDNDQAIAAMRQR